MVLPEEYQYKLAVTEIPAINIYGRRAVPLPTEKGHNFIRITDYVNLPEGGLRNTLFFEELKYKMRTSLGKNKLVCLNFTVHAMSHSGAVIASRQITDTSDQDSWPNYWVTGDNGEVEYIKIQNANHSGVDSAFRAFIKKYGFNPQVKQFILTFEPTNFKGAQTGYTIHELTLRLEYGGTSFNFWAYTKPGVTPSANLPRVSSLNVSDRIKVECLWQDVAPELAPTSTGVLFMHKEGQPLKQLPATVRKPAQSNTWGSIDGSFVEGYADIPPNTMEAGEVELELLVKANYRDVGWLPSFTRRKKYQLVDTRPTIVTLEPSGVVLDIGKAITVSWESTGQESFRLDANGSVFTGTTEKSVQIPANTFRKGENRITLKLKNNTAEFAERSKTVTFIGYGKPSLPVIADQTIYNTARPTITWESDEQHTYNLKIYKGSQMIKDSGDMVSSTPSYKVPVNLQNNTDYTIKLKVKNDRGLWSDEAVKTIRISFSELKPATLTLYASNRGTVTVNVTNPTDATFSYCEVWRKRSYDTEWTRIAKEAPITVAFSDQLLAANTEYQYKAISYNKQGGAVESAIKTVTVEVPEMEFIDLGTMQKIASGYAESPDEPFSRQRVQDRQLMRFEGLRAPVMEIGETDYSVINFSLSFRRYADLKQFEAEANRAKLLLFRSTQGHLHFGLITDWGSEKISATGITSIDFTFTEMEFVPSEIYVAGQQVGIVLTDQGYTFGG